MLRRPGVRLPVDAQGRLDGAAEALRAARDDPVPAAAGDEAHERGDLRGRAGAVAGALRPPAGRPTRRCAWSGTRSTGRSRGGSTALAPEAQGQPNYTGDLSFAEFADRLVGGEVPLGTSSNFVTDADGTVIVDRMYRYEHLDAATAWMSERLGIARADARADQRLSGPRGGDGRRHPGPARGALRPGPRHLRERHLRACRPRISHRPDGPAEAGPRGLPTYDGGHESGLPTGHPGAPCPGRPAGDPGPREDRPVPRRLHRRGRLLRDLRLPHHRAAGLRGRAHRPGVAARLLRPPGPPDPARGDAGHRSRPSRPASTS